MSGYNENDLKSVLVYIRDSFGIEVFEKRGQALALLGDLAPSLRNEKRMLEKMFKIGILEDFTSSVNSDERTKKSVIARSLTTLTVSEYIRPKVAAEYINILVAVFGWNIPVELPKESKEEEMILYKLASNNSAAEKQAYADAYKMYYRTKPRNTFDSTIEVALKAVNAENLYTFLKPELSEREYHTQVCSELLALAAEKAKSEFLHNDPISAAGKQLCNKCMLIFKDEASKTDYDEYLDYQKRRKILDDAENLAKMVGDENNKRLSAGQSKSIINELASVLKNLEIARNLFMGFCERRKIKTDPGVYGEAERKNLKICRCGCINDISDGRKICIDCGQHLFIKCPVCGVENDISVKICKCGFNYDNINRAINLCLMADEAINKLMFDAAKVYISEAELCYSETDKLTEVRNRLNDSKVRLGRYAQEIDEYVKNSMFFRAFEKIKEIEAVFPNYSNDALKNKLSKAISKANEFLYKAKMASDEKSIIELAEKALAVCKDYPDIRDLVEEYPPLTPENLSVSCDGIRKVNNISWTDQGNCGNIIYTVVRNEKTIPTSDKDGKIIGRISFNNIDDCDIHGGVQYYYAVFAERVGVFSKPTVTVKPVVNLFEIFGAEAVAGDSSVKLSWKSVPENSEINIFRIEDGKEVYVSSTKGCEYLDSGLENDIEYTYRVAVGYIINGKCVLSSGIIVKAIPMRLPKPTVEIEIRQIVDEKFELKWKNSSDGKIMFFVSESMPEFKMGQVVSFDSIQNSMHLLQFTSIDKENEWLTAVFRHLDEEIIYILPVTKKNGVAVVGELIRANRSGTIKIEDVRIINNKIGVFIVPPKKATGLLLLYNENNFVTDVNDKGSNKISINMEQFMLNNMLYINEAEEKKYFLTLFAEYAVGDKSDYSSPAFYEFDNSRVMKITYSVHMKKKPFRQRWVELTFEADQKSFILPELDVTIGRGNIPVFRSSAELLKSIPEQQVEGRLTIKIPLDKQHDKNIFVKVFLKDETLLSKYQLSLDVNSQYKIS